MHQNKDLQGNFANWNKRSIWKTYGNVTMVKLDKGEVCFSKSKDYSILMQFPLSISWHESSKFCKRLGGRLNLATSQRSFNKTLEMIKHGESMFPDRCQRVWMGANDEQKEGVWRDSESGDIVDLSEFWCEGQPNGLRRQNCAGIWDNVGNEKD